MKIKIRAETANDITAIRKVNISAFPTRSEADLVDLLRAGGADLISLVAESVDQEIIGHILFSPVTLTDHPELKLAGLAPMAVTPASQKKGVGSLLVKNGLKQCLLVGYKGIVVLGHPNYYPRFGFVPSVNFGIKSEYDVPEEVFMIKELKEGNLKGCRGIVKYHPTFNEL